MYVKASDALEIKWGYSVRFPSLQAIWEGAPRQGITSMVGGKCITHPFKIKFHGWWEIQNFRVIKSQRDSVCGRFLLLPWRFLVLSLALPPWQLTARHFSLWPEAKRVHVHPLGKCAVSFVSWPTKTCHQWKTSAKVSRLPQVPSPLP